MQALNILKAYEELVWRKGDERCERTYKPVQAQREEQAQRVGQEAPREQEAPMDQRIAPDGFRQVSSKREEVSAKLNERYLVGQPTQNPFMPSNNYIQDIENQMNFLTPQKSD